MCCDVWVGVIPKALRGHPRYLSFKILSGNIALGEKVAPNEREIEAASRRTSATSAIAHVTAVHVSSTAISSVGRMREVEVWSWSAKQL